MKKKKNFLQCWDCRMKGIDCYCDLDKKARKIVKDINKTVKEETS